MTDAVELTAEAFFEEWLKYCSNLEQRAINDFDFYHFFWRSWTDYLRSGRNSLLPEPLDWTSADGPTVLGFLTSGIDARRTGGEVSEITKRRYWRLLERVYGYAVERGYVAINPAQKLKYWDRPPSEDPIGAVLKNTVWDQCFKILRKQKESQRLRVLEIRNRALLFVLFELGLTPAEIRNLSVDSFIDRTEDKAASIRISYGGINQIRELVITDEVRFAVIDWLRVRASAGKHALTTALFSAQTGKAMTDENLLVLVRNHLRSACQEAGECEPPRCGPQIVRNTRLVQWLLSGIPQEQVALRAGLKNVKGLKHLRQHLPDGPRLVLSRVANRRDDEPLSKR